MTSLWALRLQGCVGTPQMCVRASVGRAMACILERQLATQGDWIRGVSWKIWPPLGCRALRGAEEMGRERVRGVAGGGDLGLGEGFLVLFVRKAVIFNRDQNVHTVKN